MLEVRSTSAEKCVAFEQDLKGKVVLLDFWTYCCINCMHVLPDLEFLEKKYKDMPVSFCQYLSKHLSVLSTDNSMHNPTLVMLIYKWWK